MSKDALHEDDGSSERTQKALTYMCASALFCDFALFGVLSPILPYIFQTGDVSVSALEILFMSKAAAEVILLPFSGYAIDVLGARKCMCAGLVVCAVTSFLFGFTLPAQIEPHRKYCLLIAWRSLSGVASSLIGPSSGALVGLTMRPSATGRAFGGLGVGMILGMVAGPCLAAFTYVAPSMPFVVLGSICVAVLVFHCVISTALPSRLTAGENTHDMALQGAWQLVRDPCLWCCTVPLVAAVSVDALITVAQPLHLADDTLHLGPGVAVKMFVIFGTVALVSAFAYPRVSMNWLSCPMHILVGNVFMFLGLAMLFLSTNIATIACGNAIAGFSIAPIRVASFMLLNALVKFRGLKVFGFAMACQSMMACLGFLLGPSFAAVFGTCWSCMVVASGALLLFIAALPFYAQEVEDYRIDMKNESIKSELTKEAEHVMNYTCA